MSKAKEFSFVTITDAAKMVGLTTSRLRQLLRAGRLDGEKVGPRAWLLSRSDVAELAKFRKKR